MAGYASKEEARKVLEKMAEAVRADEAIRGGCGGQSLSAAFELTDYNLTLFIKFENGRVEASVGAPPEEPKVRLSLESPVLDALFSGAIDGIRAAMDGNL
ncbi:MAG TPA: SCP2 sterol-binding domain-containing protein, partial [Bacillota bacterium]